jgi:putative lipase involved disintegration of autophagic bodies
METKCHVGSVCTYRVRNVPDEDEDPADPPAVRHGRSISNSTPGIPPALGWRVDIRHHRIHEVIDNIIEPWPTVPACVVDAACRDCAGWTFT